ncbi:MAG: hypothetical protein JSV86_18445 [Gemmatimonadota bacterium]|nr:MAG: hypothetical protein JSV86_18445 [Gemmatimonadota bacterium]
MAASIVPLLLVAGGVALMLGAKKKAKKITPTIPADRLIRETYEKAMSPEVTDLAYLARVRDWLRRQGREDLAGNIASKIASIEAGIAAREAAEARQRAAERRAWEVEQKQPPLSKAKADELFRTVMSPGFEGGIPQAEFALSLIRLYGTPQQVAALTRRIAEMKAAEEPIEVKAPTPEPEVRIPPGEIPTERETPEPFEPQPPTAKFPPAEPAPPLAKELPEEPKRPPPAAPPPEVPPPLAEEEVQPPADPNGTIALARTMINRESTSGWKTALQPQIQSWQSRVGLTPDGKFGPKSLLRMGREVGILPRVRYFPRGSPSKEIAVKRVRRDLFTLAANLDEAGKKEHAAAIRLSAEQEKGQGWPTRPKAEPVTVRQEEVRLLQKTLDAIKAAAEGVV